jgi:hypothetical protein
MVREDEDEDEDRRLNESEARSSASEGTTTTREKAEKRRKRRVKSGQKNRELEQGARRCTLTGFFALGLQRAKPKSQAQVQLFALTVLGGTYARCSYSGIGYAEHRLQVRTV